MDVPNSVVIYNERARRAALNDAQRFVRRTSRLVLNRARITAPIDTGELTASHELSLRTTTFQARGTITARAPYSLEVHEGTRAHIIRPKKIGGRLRFVVNGKVVYATQVRHPGARAQPWLRDSLIKVTTPLGYRYTPS